MMIGETTRLNPTIQVPLWDPLDDPTVTVSSPFSSVNFNGGGDSPHSSSPFLDSLTSLHRYLPSNEFATESDDESSLVDAFSCDQFRMYEFKVRRCARGRSHDWTECPFAHPGEKARRRDPRKYHYSGTACPEFRKGGCRKGDACEFAHGVFECWLHPARYRTQPCKDGTACRRRVCFFAHTPEQLRVLPRSDETAEVTGFATRHLFGDTCFTDETEIGGFPTRHRFGDTCFKKSDETDVSGFPARHRFESYGSFLSSPTSILASPPLSPPSDSPPVSPSYANEQLVASMRKMQINSWAGYGSPRSSILRPGFCNSLPSTPTRNPTRPGCWDTSCEEEPVMERVESGKELRAKMYAKLSKENSLDRVDSPGPDVGWVSELVK